MSNPFDFNDAGEQKGFEVIPDNTIVTVQMTIKGGGTGPDGWLTHAHTEKGDSDYLNCALTIVEGDHAKRKIYQNYTVSGTTQGHIEAADISRKALAAMLESAHGIRPDDKSEAAQKARRVAGWGDFDGLRFMARVGVRPPQNGYAAKNVIKEVITPDRHGWKKVEQIDRSQLANTPTASTAPQASQPAVNPIARPDWAK
jgi:hypothetical protein